MTSLEYVWRNTPLQERWAAFRAYRDATEGTLAQFLAEGPYVRLSWLPVL